jgi:hypothetical protein
MIDGGTTGKGLRSLSQGQRALLEVVMNQAGWFACILLAAAAHPVWAALCAVPVCALHLLLSHRPRAVLGLMLAAMIAGWLADSLIAHAGWVIYGAADEASFVSAAQGAQSGAVALAPAWIAGLWAMFATLLECPLAWLGRRRLLAVLLGAVGGPLAWWAGVRLGAGRVDGAIGYAIIGFEWAVATPLLVACAERVRRLPTGLMQA